MVQPRVLIVEDEPDVLRPLAWQVKKEGYELLEANDGLDGLEKATTHLPDVIILDLNLPRMSGLDVCRELRKGERTRHIPIVMLTARAEEVDQVEGFSAGADDYVTKPFSNKVLMQRIKAVLRRGSEGTAEQEDVIEHLGVRIDRMRHRVSCAGKDIDLTPTEFRLLECMVRQPGRAFSRPQLMDAAIGEGSIVLERTIDVHVKTLRKKLEEKGGSTDMIETVRGVGYRFRETESEATV